MAGNEKIRSSAAIVLFLKSLGMGGRQKKGENKKIKAELALPTNRSSSIDLLTAITVSGAI